MAQRVCVRCGASSQTRRIGWRWYLAALVPFGLYGLATILAGATDPFTFSPDKLFRILFSAEAGFLVYLFLRGAMGEEIGLRGFALPARDHVALQGQRDHRHLVGGVASARTLAARSARHRRLSAGGFSVELYLYLDL